MPRIDGRHRQPLHSADGIQKYLCRHMSLARLRLPNSTLYSLNPRDRLHAFSDDMLANM